MFRTHLFTRQNSMQNKSIFWQKSRHIVSTHNSQPIPYLLQNIFSNKNVADTYAIQGFLIRDRIINEFKQNSFARNVLTGANYLIENHQLTFCQSESMLEDYKAFEKNKAVFYYDTQQKMIHVPFAVEIAFQLMPFLKTRTNNFQRDPMDYFVGALIHECTHAIDDLLAQLATTSKDKVRIRQDYEWLLKGTDFKDYEKNEMRELCQALQIDRQNLDKLVSLGNKAAHEILYFINLIDESITKTNFLDEMKGYLVQMTTQGAFGNDTVKKYLPETSRWFFETFVPLVENGMRPQVHFKP